MTTLNQLIDYLYEPSCPVIVPKADDIFALIDLDREIPGLKLDIVKPNPRPGIHVLQSMVNSRIYSNGNDAPLMYVSTQGDVLRVSDKPMAKE